MQRLILKFLFKNVKKKPIVWQFTSSLNSCFLLQQFLLLGYLLLCLNYEEFLFGLHKKLFMKIKIEQTVSSTKKKKLCI